MLGDNILEFLKKRKITKTKLANEVGVDPSTIHGYITNERIPNAVILYDIAVVLNTTVERLISDDSRVFGREADNPDVSFVDCKEIIDTNAACWSDKEKADLVNSIFGVLEDE